MVKFNVGGVYLLKTKEEIVKFPKWILDSAGNLVDGEGIFGVAGRSTELLGTKVTISNINYKNRKPYSMNIEEGHRVYHRDFFKKEILQAVSLEALYA